MCFVIKFITPLTFNLFCVITNYKYILESSPTTDAPSTSDASPSNPPVDNWEEEADKEHAEGMSELDKITIG